MKKTRNAPTSKAEAPGEGRDEIIADRLVELAIDLRESDIYKDLPDELKKAQSDLRKTINKALQKQREQALEEALEHAFEEDADAYRVLRDYVEELAGTALFHRDTGPDLEVNAFVVPFFVHSTGGLRAEQDFQDEQAFEQLRESFKEYGLESKKANLVLVAHAYHLDEIDRIDYCQLNAMVHEAFDAMTRKKASAANAIAASMRGWPPSQFAADDNAMELRFLLGFTLKTMDDPFYHVPEKEAAADRYFEARAERFRKWSQEITSILKRCLVTDGRDVQIDYLYQDLFHGGKEAAIRELEMIQLISDVQQLLETHGIAPEDTKAIIGPTEDDDEVLRVSLLAKADDAVIDFVDKPLGRTEILENAVADVADGLATVGIQDMFITRSFDVDGLPKNVRPYTQR